MPTVSFRVSAELKERMEEHDEINWSAILREQIRDELSDLETRDLAHAVATSERLSGAIDPEAVADQNSAERIREWRDGRYGPGSTR